LVILALENLPAFGREALHKIEPSNGMLLPYYLLYIFLIVPQMNGLLHAPPLNTLDYGVLQVWSGSLVCEERLEAVYALAEGRVGSVSLTSLNMCCSLLLVRASWACCILLIFPLYQGGAYAAVF
jgi:hypothetical protein